MPVINIRGAAIGTVAGYATSAILNMSAIIKHQKSNIRITRMVLKPAIATGAMVIAAYASYRVLFEAIGRNSAATLLAISFAAVVYIIVLILIKGIAVEELKWHLGEKGFHTYLRKEIIINTNTRRKSYAKDNYCGLGPGDYKQLSLEALEIIKMQKLWFSGQKNILLQTA